MKPIINLEDPVGKTVGRRLVPDPLRLVPGERHSQERWRAAGFFPKIPKGVYRFPSHEEADEWLWQMMVRRRN